MPLYTSLTKTVVAGSIIAATALAVSAPAAAQPKGCGDRAEMVAHLAKKYQEQPTAFGLQSDGKVVEIFSSKDSGSWTILISTPNGTSCLASTGHAWQPVAGRPLKPNA